MGKEERVKSLFYKITREKYIESTIDDYRKGHQITGKIKLERKKELMKKHGIETSNTHEKCFALGYCCICNKNFMSTDKINEGKINSNHDSIRISELNKHLAEVHENKNMNTPASKKVQEQWRKFERKWEEEKQKDENEVLKKWKNMLVKVENRVWKCLKCKKKFARSCSAMILHAEEHEKDNIVKIGMTTGSKRYRPEQHLTNQHGNFYFGSDAAVNSYFIPNNIKKTGGKLWCRNCDDFGVDWIPRWMSAQVKARRIMEF